MSRLWRAMCQGVEAFHAALQQEVRSAAPSRPETPAIDPVAEPESTKPFSRLAAETAERMVDAMLEASRERAAAPSTLPTLRDPQEMLADVLTRAGTSAGVSGLTEGVALDLILDISATNRRSGRLWVRTRSELLTFDLRDGRIVRAGALGPDNLSERLGEVLIGMGTIDRATISECLEEAERRRAPIGAVLMERGQLTVGQLREALHQQAIMRLSRALFCQGAAYAYTRSNLDLAEPICNVALDASELVETVRASSGPFGSTG